MKPLSRPFLLLPVLIAVLLSGGLGLYISKIPDVNPDNSPAAGGIIVLTGGSGRIDAGLDALRKGMGRRLLISGINQNLSEETILSANRIEAQLVNCCVDLGRAATNTRTNAQEAAAWIREHGFTSVLLVTEDYHMPRSIIEFEIHGTEARIYPLPVEGRAGPGTLMLEGAKYWVSRLRLAFADRRVS